VVRHDHQSVREVYAGHVPLVIPLDQVGEIGRGVGGEDERGGSEEDGDEDDWGSAGTIKPEVPEVHSRNRPYPSLVQSIAASYSLRPTNGMSNNGRLANCAELIPI
jgi:hypothetical protein